MGGGGGDGPKEEVGFGRQLCVFFVFAMGNIGLNYFNSWALHKADWPGLEKGGFKFPFFYTMFHMISSSLAAILLQCTCARPKDGSLPSFGQLWKYKFQLFPIAVFTVLNTAFNNWSLVLVALFINQVIKACAPAVTGLLEFVFLGKVYNWVIYLMVFGICAGSGVSQLSNLGGESKELILGLIVCTISLFAASAKGVLQKIITSGTKDLKPLEPTQAIVWDCGISFVIMFIVWIVSDERDESIAYLRGQTPNDKSGLLALGIISFGSFLAFMFNIANYYFIHYTSALTMTIGSNGVKVFLLVVSAITDGMTSIPSITGIAIVVCSICGYAYFSFTAKKPPPRAQTADSDMKQPLATATESTPLAAK
jgi:hypothetical protein